jgi:arylsulfatase A-like enzyme
MADNHSEYEYSDVLKRSLKISLSVGLTTGVFEAAIIALKVLMSNTIDLLLMANLIEFVSVAVLLFVPFLMLVTIAISTIFYFSIGKKFDAARIQIWILRLSWFSGSFFLFAIWLNYNTLRPFFSLVSLAYHLMAVAGAIVLAEVATRLTNKTFTEFVLLKNRKPRPIALLWGMALLFSFFYGYYSEVDEQTDKPNVIFLIVDTLRADRLGCYGYAKNTTPHIDAAAQQSVLFEQAYVPWASSLPSHASIMTSLPPHLHGAFPNGNKLNPELLTLAKVLKAYGYTNGAFVTNTLVGNQYNFQLGFDRFFDLTQIEYENSTFDAWLHSLNIIRVIDEIRQIDIFTELATAWIERNKDKPVFLWVQWLYPHYPYDPPPEFLKKVEPANGVTDVVDKPQDRSVLYDGEVAYTDFLVGRIIDKLKELSLLDNSLLVITSDHGENIYDHNVGRGHAGVYDTSIRIPLIFRFPQQLPVNKKVGQVVQSIDITPTILDILEIPKPKQFQGKSLKPLMFDDASNWQPVAYSAMLQKQRNFFALRSDDWKIILHVFKDRQPEFELYHIPSDPEELTNRVQTDVAVADSLKQKLTSWIETNFKPVEIAYTPGLQLKQEFDKATEERLRSLGYIK